MRQISPLRRVESTPLTRISVTGSDGLYFVQRGNAPAVRVWVTPGTRDGMRCECAVPGCVHIESLVMCGFVACPEEGRQAA